MSEHDDTRADDAEALHTLASRLMQAPPPGDVEQWSARTRAAARPILAARARRAYRRRVASALAAACVPLPLVVVYARALLGWLYEGLARLLPAPFPDLAVASYAATTALLVAATFAAVPVLVELSMRTARPIHGE